MTAHSMEPKQETMNKKWSSLILQAGDAKAQIENIGERWVLKLVGTRMQNSVDITDLFQSEITHAIEAHDREIVEKVLKLAKEAEKFVPFQKIHHQSAITDVLALLNKQI